MVALTARPIYTVGIIVALAMLCYFQTKRLWAAERTNEELTSHATRTVESTRTHAADTGRQQQTATRAAVAIAATPDADCLDRAAPDPVLDAIRLLERQAADARSS